MTTQSGHSTMMRSKAFAKARELKAQRKLEKELAKREKVLAKEIEAAKKLEPAIVITDKPVDWILENTAEYEPPEVRIETRGRPRKPRSRYRPEYAAWVIPLDGEPILIGPYKRKKLVMAERMKTVERLIGEGNARESDIKQLALYHSGYFDDDENDK